MNKFYTATTKNVTALARSKRLRQAGVVSAGSASASASTSTGIGAAAMNEALDSFLQQVAALYLSKVEPDTAQQIITFEQGLKSTGAIDANGKLNANGDVNIAGTTDYGKSLVPGVSGGGIWRDDLGNWHAQFDFLRANKKMEASEVEIEKVSHIGGAFVLSAASCTIVEVEKVAVAVCQFDGKAHTVNRCYFNATDGEVAVKNCWKAGDQARVQTFNLVTQQGMAGNHYWWGVVLNTGTTDDGTRHYIDLPTSAGTTILDTYSDEPAVGDNVVLFGSRTGEPNRENVIMIDSAGAGSPYIRIYRGITSFQMPRPRIDLNPENPRLDVEELTITASDGSTHELSDMLDESFLIWYVEEQAPRDSEDLIISELSADYPGWPVAAGEFGSNQYTAHLGDVALTTDGVCYRFETDGTAFKWVLKSDKYLIWALEQADASASTLRRMADDNIITVAEKKQLDRWRKQIEAEREQICIEAASVSVETVPFLSAYNCLHAFLDYICTDTLNDTYLIDEEGRVLYASASASLFGKAPTYTISYIRKSLAMPIGKEYEAAVTDYFAQLNRLRTNITGGVREEIAHANKSGYDQVINDYVLSLKNGLLQELIADSIQGNASIARWDSFYSVISNWAWSWDEAHQMMMVNGAGLLTSENFASLFAKSYAEDGELASALLEVFVQQQTGADGEKWVSGVNIAADKFTVNTQNFRLDLDGNLEITGSIHTTQLQETFEELPVLYASSIASAGESVTYIEIYNLLRGMYYHRVDGELVPYQPRGRNLILCHGETINLGWLEAGLQDMFPHGSRLLIYNKPRRIEGTDEVMTLPNTIYTQDANSVSPRRNVIIGTLWTGTGIRPTDTHMTPANRIRFSCGVLEFLSMPMDNDQGVQWCLTRHSSAFYEERYVDPSEEV